MPLGFSNKIGEGLLLPFLIPFLGSFVVKQVLNSLEAEDIYICPQLHPATAECIIESVDSINRDERGFPLTQYITNGGTSRAGYTITHFTHHHHVLWRISNRMSV